MAVPIVITTPPDTLTPVNVETPEYVGPAYMLLLVVPVERVPDIDRNDTLRREVTGAIASAIPSAPVGG